MDDDFDDINPRIIDIDDTPDRRIKEGALRMYNGLREQGKPIPPQLQDYIDNGLKRIAKGLTGFPANRAGEYNPLKIYSLVTAQIEDHGKEIESAIDMVAGELDMTERQVSDVYNKVISDPTSYVYYLHSYLKDQFKE